VRDLSWVHEPSPTWDADKRRVIGSAPAGVFDLAYVDGEALPGDWWACSSDGAVLGYGWLDATWGGDAEILLAVDASARTGGVGSYILQRLEDEAAGRGLNYVYNTVRATHPDRDDLHDWLAVRGYRGGTSDTTLRKRVGDGSSGHRPRTSVSVPSGSVPSGSVPSRAEPSAGVVSPAGERGPGGEESGGYVDVEDHRY
jgi:GNAT superfamily N-acetyltransferase